MAEVKKQSPKTLSEYAQKFWAKVNKTDSCWLWTAAIHSGGYGVFRINGTPGELLYAHRFAYELVRGPIPAGLQMDHLCRVRNCVNPEHLEPVTPKENVDRGLGRKRTHCCRGHEMTGQSVYYRPDDGKRQCLICKHEYWAQWYAKRKEKAKAEKPALA